MAVTGVTPPVGSAGLHYQPRLLNIFINDLNTGLEGIISKFTDDTKLGEALTCLEGREALQRDLTNRDRQSPTVWSLTREVSDSAHGTGTPGLVYVLGKERLESSCMEGPGGPGQGQDEHESAVPRQSKVPLCPGGTRPPASAAGPGRGLSRSALHWSGLTLSDSSI